MSEIEKSDKEVLEDRALEMHLEGRTNAEIAESIGRHRNTVATYIGNAIARMPVNTLDEQRKKSALEMEWVKKHAKGILTGGSLKASSTNNPQLLHQIIKAQELQDKNAGLQNAKVQVGIFSDQVGETVVDFIRNADATGTLDSIGGDYSKRHDDWMKREDDEDVHTSDLELDPADGVYKLRSEFE